MTLSHHRAGTGEPLLLIHGLGSDLRAWEPVLPALQREREVIAIDLPGFGGSPPLAPGVAPTAARLAQEVAAFLDEVRWPRPHVAGNSLGGWIALELAKLGRARSVVALSPAGFWSAGELRFSRASLRASRALARSLRPVLRAALATAAGRRLLLWQMYARPARIPAAAAIAAVEGFAAAPGFDATFDAISVPEGFRGEIACPATIAWGGRDRLLLPRQLVRARERLPGARAVTLAGCGHVPTWDDPEQVARVLLGG